jgi:hypothetical protein
MTRHELLTSVGKTVHGLIAQLTPDPQTSCFKAFERLGGLCRTSKAVTALEEPAYFTAGIQEVIQMLDAHRTGFARTAEQENGSVKKSATELSLLAFAAHSSKVVTKALEDVSKGQIGAALEALHTLYRDVVKAESFEDTTTATIAVTNDPMRVIETEAAGTMTAAQPASTSNAVSNPEAVKAPPPSTEANPSTGSATALPTASAGAPAFVDTAKAAAAEEASVTKALKDTAESISKAAVSQGVDPNQGWARDLNSPAFRGGVDFEAGLPKRG